MNEILFGAMIGVLVLVIVKVNELHHRVIKENDRLSDNLAQLNKRLTDLEQQYPHGTQE